MNKIWIAHLDQIKEVKEWFPQYSYLKNRKISMKV